MVRSSGLVLAIEKLDEMSSWLLSSGLTAYLSSPSAKRRRMMPMS